MHLRLGAVLAAAFGLLALVTSAPALAFGDILPNQAGKPDLDARGGSVTPTAAQQQIVSSLGAHATWNQFGTPKSLIKYGGYLATGLSNDPVAAAKTFITSDKALFRLSDAGVANLQLLNDSPMVGSDGHAVLFRQTFGGLPATQDGLITVGVVDGKVAYVSSSSAGDGNAPAAATLAPLTAWTLAAANVGLSMSVVDLSRGKNINGWLTFKAAGLNNLQRVRLTALPTPNAGVRPAYEAIVLDVRNNGHAEAYTSFVDAVTGQVLVRHDDVQQFARRRVGGRESDVRVERSPLLVRRHDERDDEPDDGLRRERAVHCTGEREVGRRRQYRGQRGKRRDPLPRRRPGRKRRGRELRRGDEPRGGALRAERRRSHRDALLGQDVPIAQSAGTLPPAAHLPRLARVQRRRRHAAAAGAEHAEVEGVQGEPAPEHDSVVPVEQPEHGHAHRLVLAGLAEQPVAGGLELPVRGQEHRVACSVGRRAAHRRHDRHDDGEQRDDRRSLGQPADRRGHAPAAAASGPRVHRRVEQHLVQHEL